MTERDQIALLVNDIGTATKRLEKILAESKAERTGEHCSYGRDLGGETPKGEYFKHSFAYWIPLTHREDFRRKVFALGELISLSVPTFGDVPDSVSLRYGMLTREAAENPGLAAEAPWSWSLAQDEIARLAPAVKAYQATEGKVQVYVYMKTRPGTAINPFASSIAEELRRLLTARGVLVDPQMTPYSMLERLFEVGSRPAKAELMGATFGLLFQDATSQNGEGALLVGFDDTRRPEATNRFRLTLASGDSMPRDPEASFARFRLNASGWETRTDFRVPQEREREIIFDRLLSETRTEEFRIRKLESGYVMRIEGFGQPRFAYLSRRIRVD